MFYCSFVSIHYIICECGDTFPTEDALKEHLEKHHNPRNEIVQLFEYKCDTCQKVFSSERACLIHQRIHIKPRIKLDKNGRGGQRKPKCNTNKTSVCEICGKTYASKAMLKYHQRAHTGERPYQCSICPKKFAMPLFLQIHIRTHTGERPYECPHCPKAFSNQAALQRHDRVHTGIKPYKCPKCGKAFTQSNSMKLHVKTVHLKMPAPYKSKNRKNKQALKQAASGMNVQVQIEKGVYQPEIKSEAQVYEEVEAYGETDEYEVYQDEELYRGIKVEGQEVAMYSDDPDTLYEEVYISVKDEPNECH